MAASKSMATDRALDARRWAARWWHGRTGGDACYAAGMVVALAYYYLVPSPLLALPGLVAFAALAWLRLELALCLLPLTFPFWYVPKRALGQAVFPLSEIALGVCLAVAIGHLIVRMWATANAKHAKKREGREEGEQIRTAEGTEDHRGYSERRQRAKGQPDSAGSSAKVAGRATPASSISPFFAIFADLRVLRVPRILTLQRWRWLVIGAALLLLGAAAGVLVAVRPREALRAFRWEVAEPVLYAALLVACLWGWRVVPGAGTRPGGSDVPGDLDGHEHLSGRMIAWLARPVLAVGTLFGVLAIAQVFWLRVSFTALAAGNQLVALPTVVGTSLLRATGIYYGSANSLGALLERVLPLALALLLWRILDGNSASSAVSPPSPLASSAASTSSPPASPSSVPSTSSVVNPSLLLGGCVLVMAAGLALTGSRGAEVGAVAGLLLVLLVHPRTRRIALGIALLGVVVALWQASALLQAALVGHGASGEVRLLLWQSALHMIRDHPLLGIGPDQFLYYYDPAYSAHPYWIPRIGGHLTPAAFQPDLAQPHNLALDLWLSGGVLGLVGFALVLGWLARSCWRVWRASRRAAAGRWTMRTALIVGVAGGVFAGLTHGMVDSAYFQPDLALLFWWSVAVAALLCVAPAGNATPRFQSTEVPSEHDVS